MQPTELWRRGVVLPHNPEVAQRINDWDVDESVAVEYLAITDGALFSQLWDIGLFAAINEACGTRIDDYEAEWLLPAHFPTATIIVERLLKNHCNRELGDFLRRLSGLIGRAAEARMPLYFVC